jgi:hypothetical protein
MGEKGPCGGIVELMNIFALDAFDGAAELGTNIRKKVSQSGESVGLKSQICPKQV